MKTELELATEHAHEFVRNRGWRCEPLTWEETEELIKAMDGNYAEFCSCGCTGECAA